MPPAYSCLNHFRCLDALKQKWQCLQCLKESTGGSVRRKLEHLLDVGTTVKACEFSEKELTQAEHQCLVTELEDLDRDLQRRKKRKQATTKAVADITIPKRLRQGTITFDQRKIDALNLEYARMLIVNCVKTGFMESPFTATFFQREFNFKPPSRKMILGPLLDTLYLDTASKVKEACNFTSADAFCTVSMDGWESPTGAHVRNYMLVLSHVTFMHTATLWGTMRPTGRNIGEEAARVRCS